ncbi:UNVERIFIED_CONTAM: hypothetical protein GTU68_064375 [Idotea baltica]|nr:hypothetical protein [Idotea baltica]
MRERGNFHKEGLIKVSLPMNPLKERFWKKQGSSQI